MGGKIGRVVPVRERKSSPVTAAGDGRKEPGFTP